MLGRGLHCQSVFLVSILTVSYFVTGHSQECTQITRKRVFISVLSVVTSCLDQMRNLIQDVDGPRSMT